MAKKPRKRATKKRKQAPPSDAAPAGFSPEAQGFDYPAAVKKLQNVKSCVNETEIGKCIADIDYKKKLPAIAAIMAFGCCICNTMLIAICGFVFCVVGPGLVGKDIDDFKEDYESTKEYIALKTGEIRELDWEWVKLKKNRDQLDKRSEKKVKARLETTTAPKKEESVGKDMEVDKELDAEARAVLGESCTLVQLRAIRCDLGPMEKTECATKQGTIGVILGVLRAEVSGLGETALHEELSKTSLGAAVDAGADLEKLCETYVHGRVLELTHTIRLEKKNFYKGGVFQESEARAYVESITDKTERGKSRQQVLKAKIRTLDGFAGVADKDLDTELLKAYKANAPEVVEAKEDPFYAPKLNAVMGSVRDALLKAKGGVDVVSSLINIVVVFMCSIKGPVLATDGHVIYVSKAWLVWLIATNRRPRTDLSFRNFKKEKGAGKREDYFKNDGFYSARNLKSEHQPIVDASKAYDEEKDTLGEIVHGGAGSAGMIIVMFILFQKKYFVLMHRKQMVVNPVTAGCLAYLASMVYSILSLKVERGARGGTVLAGGQRLSDVVKGDSDDPERVARTVVRTKWGPMTSVLDGFFASLLERLAATDSTLADAPADIAKAARAADLDEYSAAPEYGGGPAWGFNRGAVEGFMLRLRGGQDDCCGTGTAPGGGGRAKKSKPGPRKRGLRANLAKRWSKAQVQEGWNAN